MTGKVKFFNNDKGYGFIIHDNTGEETFVHVKGCKEPIKTDDAVRFDTKEGKKGVEAYNVEKI